MKRKKNRLAGFTVDTSASWSLFKVSADGAEQLLASGLTLDRAVALTEHHLVDCHPGERLSLREAPVWEGALLA